MKGPRKKTVFRAAVAVVGAIAGIHLGSALTLDRQVQYKEIELRSEKVGAELDGYTIAFLTDIHRTPLDRLDAIAAQVQAHGVDLVLFGGDFQASEERLGPVLDTLAAIAPPDGFYGVEGNHDRADTLRAAMAARGMVLLENTGAPVRDGLWLGGVEDLYNRNPDPQAAIAGAGAQDLVLLLSHNPDVASGRDNTGVDLMLSGHTHGGEVSLFGLWSPAVYMVSGHGQRYRSGWCRSPDGLDVFVSNGIGSHSPLRVLVRPQVILLTLRSPLPDGL